MSEKEKEQKNFIGYEYKEMIAEGSRASLLLDGYESFGWEIDENLTESGESRTVCRSKQGEDQAETQPKNYQ